MEQALSESLRTIDILLDQRRFIFDPETYDAFVDALENPSPAGAKLKALIKRKPLWQNWDFGGV